MINLKKFTSVGIVGYAAYVPAFRVSVEEIAQTWGKDGRQITEALGVRQKAVSGTDEDCLTMAVEASQKALTMAGIKPFQLGACFMGSESFPYAVKPSSTTLAAVLGMDNDYFTADLQFACKAGTAGLQLVAAMIEAGMIDYGLVVGSDKAQSRPADALEYTAASAAVAVILGRPKHKWLATFEVTSSFNSDTPDFWRRQEEKFPSHASRFTGEPAYFQHVVGGTQTFLKKIKKRVTDFDFVIFHSPNQKFPLKTAKALGVTKKQLRCSLLVENIGNPYSASTLVSLANVLDNAKGQENILMTSYGSGAGADSFWWRVTKNLSRQRKEEEKTQNLTYSQYLRQMEII